MKLAAALLLVLIWSSTAAAAEPEPVPVTMNLLFLAFGGTVWGTGETVVKARLAPNVCRWCNDNALDSGARSSLRWDDVELARMLSNSPGTGSRRPSG
jgi:hypothetical protein